MYPYIHTESLLINNIDTRSSSFRALIKKYRDDDAATVTVPKVKSLFFKNIFNLHVQPNTDRGIVNIPLIVSAYKKSLRIFQDGGKEAVELFVPNITRIFIKAYVKFLKTFGKDEQMSVNLPLIKEIYSTCLPSFNKIRTIILRAMDTGVEVKWENNSITYSTVLIYRSTSPVGVRDPSNLVGTVPYGIKTYMDNFTPVNGQTYYYVLVITAGTQIIVSDLQRVRFTMTPTDNIVLKFTSKIVASKPYRLIFNKK